MNDRELEKQRVWQRKRLKYGMVGIAAGYLVAGFAVTAAAPMMISEECQQLQARMTVDGTAHLNPHPETGKLSPEQEKLQACFSSFNTAAQWGPLFFMIGGMVVGHRKADQKYKPKDPGAGPA